MVRGRASISLEVSRMAASTQGNLVEMNWDPITRIVGSLGIYTKVDFSKRKVAECYSTSSIFRGYSIFMQGKDPHPLGRSLPPHRRHSGICAGGRIVDRAAGFCGGVCQKSSCS